jgi:hypothetical protein
MIRPHEMAVSPPAPNREAEGPILAFAEIVEDAFNVVCNFLDFNSFQLFMFTSKSINKHVIKKQCKDAVTIISQLGQKNIGPPVNPTYIPHERRQMLFNNWNKILQFSKSNEKHPNSIEERDEMHETIALHFKESSNIFADCEKHFMDRNLCIKMIKNNKFHSDFSIASEVNDSLKQLSLYLISEKIIRPKVITIGYKSPFKNKDILSLLKSDSSVNSLTLKCDAFNLKDLKEIATAAMENEKIQRMFFVKIDKRVFPEIFFKEATDAVVLKNNFKIHTNSSQNMFHGFSEEASFGIIHPLEYPKYVSSDRISKYVSNYNLFHGR